DVSRRAGAVENFETDGIRREREVPQHPDRAADILAEEIDPRLEAGTAILRDADAGGLLGLVRIGNIRADVAGVADVVPVSVGLFRIGVSGTVVEIGAETVPVLVVP